MTAWYKNELLPSKRFICGYCGAQIASNRGYTFSNSTKTIYICHECDRPTFIDYDETQTPGPIIGYPVKHIPDEKVEQLFDEAKKCFSISAFTSTVMCCRKLLMNIAVSEKAKEGLSFVEYVNYLNDNNYITPKGKQWVDSIRKLGNEANHKIAFKTQKEAERILTFTEMLLRFIYEMAGIMKETENGDDDTKVKGVSVSTESPKI